MNRILLKNSRIVNEGKIFEADVLVKDKFIDRIDSEISDDRAKIIDLEGKFLIPGLIDDQVHFREPGLTHKGDIQSESRAAVAGGVTTFMEQPNTNPQTTTIELLEEKFSRAAETSFANYSFPFGGTNTNLEEIKKLNPLACSGIKLFLGSSTGNMLIDDEAVLEQIFRATPLVISAHCEDEATIKNNLARCKDQFGENIPVEYHPIIRSAEACYLSSSRAIDLALTTGARLHVFHLSTGIETSLFRNDIPLAEKQITAEACVHHLWFSDADYAQKGSFIKWNPAVKTAADREELWEALLDDRIDVLATDHAPHTLEEKAMPYLQCPSGGPLVQHVLPALMEKRREGLISIERIVEKACHNPAILFQIKRRGFIREGYYADLVVLDENRPWTVNRNNILYKCGWSPFEGTEFGTSVLYTFVNGHPAYEKGVLSNQRNAMRLEFDRS